MAGPNPKIASLSVTVVAVAATQVGAVFIAVSEQTATDGPRVDRFLDMFIVVSLLWAVVALVDIFLFPTMRMTRLLCGPAFSTAVVIVGFQAAFQFAEWLFGESTTGLIHRLAMLGVSFTATWALTSLWGLVRERKRSPKPKGQEQAQRPGVAIPID